jgi:hypothetical protein
MALSKECPSSSEHLFGNPRISLKHMKWDRWYYSEVGCLLNMHKYDPQHPKRSNKKQTWN